jgi:hypothetical protein
LAAKQSDRPAGARPGPDSKRRGRVVPLRKASAALMAATPVSFDEDARIVTLRVGGAELPGHLSASVSPIVVRSAIERGERLIVVDEGQLLVLGALRTSPTPGVDKGEDYLIEADRVELRGNDRVAIVSGAAQILVNAVDRIEVLARDVTSRALRVHKLVGRILHLN